MAGMVLSIWNSTARTIARAINGDVGAIVELAVTLAVLIVCGLIIRWWIKR